jgi:hypothetical protein
MSAREQKGYLVQKSLGVLVALAALTLAACTGTGGGASGGGTANVLAGVVVITPIPTLPPTPTPVPTATPPGVADVIQDPNFAIEGAAGAFSPATQWGPCSYLHPDTEIETPLKAPTPAITPASAIGAVLVSASSPSFQGNPASQPITAPAIPSGNTFSALTYTGTGAPAVFKIGNADTAGANGICQTVTVPTNAMLTMSVNEGGSDENGFADQEADIITSTGTVIPIFNELNGGEFSDTGVFGQYITKGPFALTAAPYNLTPGQTVQLFIGTYDDGPGPTFGAYMFVANVALTGTPVTPASLHRKSLMNSRSLVK